MALLLNFVTPIIKKNLLRLIHRKEVCPVCGGKCLLYDIVDKNKSCAEIYGVHLPPSGMLIPYCRCVECGFVFAPTIAKWGLAEFEEHIYNEDYVLVDPEYVEERPRRSASLLQDMFRDGNLPIKHLDYGGGNGRLSEMLRQRGWHSESYDPFVDRDTQVSQLGKYNLITAIEVFEHVPSPQQLMSALSSLVADDGIIFFTTLLSDGEILPQGQLGWWYASPRNGHISLYSRASLMVLAKRYGFVFGSFHENEGYHCMWRNIPPWASHILSTKS